MLFAYRRLGPVYREPRCSGSACSRNTIYPGHGRGCRGALLSETLLKHDLFYLNVRSNDCAIGRSSGVSDINVTCLSVAAKAFLLFPVSRGKCVP